MIQRKNKLLISALASLGLFSTVDVNAADDNWYVGATFGAVTVDTGISGLTGTASVDETDNGYKLLIGKKLNKNISLEGFYANFGETSLTGNTGDRFVSDGVTYQFTTNAANVTSSVTGVGFNGKYSIFISQKSSIAARVGILSWDVSGTVSGATITTATASATGSDLFYGIGYQYNLTDSVALTADYDSYKADGGKLSMVGIGLAVNF